MCSWSLETQSCVHMTYITGNLIVQIEENCPQYTVTTDVSRDAETYAYRLKVSNDMHGFLAFLNRTRLTCWLDGAPTPGTVVDDTIVSSTVVRPWTPSNTRRLSFNYVTFDDTVLRMDDVAVNYVLPDRYCPDGDGHNRSRCVSCSWDGPDYTHFYARCAGPSDDRADDNATCPGLLEFYERRETRNYYWAPVRGDVDTRLQCPRLAVTAVDPPSARWNSGTRIRVTVGGHAVLADRRPVTVTVAGRACTALSTVDDSTLMCTVSLAGQSGASDGPVIVRYGERTVVVSAQRFRFVYPEVRTVSPVCGPLKGGTRLRVGGRSLNTSTVVRVTVGPNALECRTTDWDDQSIHCVTAPSAVATSGPVMVLFDKSLSEHVASSTFAYTDDVPTVDDGQRYRVYAALVAGHPTVKVLGRHLSCVEKAEIYYVHDHVKWYAECAVEDDTHMVCHAPGPGQWPAPDPEHFGFSVIAAGSVLDICPPPDPSGYFWFATSTTIMAVAGFALLGCFAFYYVRAKKRSVGTVAACNMVVEFNTPPVDPPPKYCNLMTS